MASTRPTPFSDLPPLTRRRLLRERRRRRRRVAAVVSTVALAVGIAGFVASRRDVTQSGASGTESVRSGGTAPGRDATADEAGTAPTMGEKPTVSTVKPPPSTRPPTRRRPSATPRGATTTAPEAVPPAGLRTGAPTASVPTTQSAPSPFVDPGAGTIDVEPQSPPVTGPAGPQGPIRATPCTPTGPPKTNAAKTDDPSSAGRWVTIGRLAGNCGATSAPATTSYLDTRLVYRSDAVQFQVFLIDQSDPATSGGFADVECRAACADAQDLSAPAGRYEIKVVATDAPWEVLLQEYR